MNFETFKDRITPLTAIYRRDNAWVGKWTHSWNYYHEMEKYIDAAFRLYRATSTNALKMVLLGGTGIRKNKDLIVNFGVTGANGIQDRETEQHVNAEQGERGPNSQTRPVPSVPVVGVGSILSEKHWTPLLNDALIIGSAAAGQEFHLALENGYHHSWRDCEQFIQWKADPEIREKLEQLQRMNSTLDIMDRRIRQNPGFTQSPGTKSAHEKLKKDYARQSTIFFHTNGPAHYKKVWQQFLYENLDMLWDNKIGAPRVLARELIGLQLFDYAPEMNYMKLGFSRPKGRPQPSFERYVKELNKLGMHKGNRARADVMKFLSAFLFDDELALRFPEDAVVIPSVASRKDLLRGNGLNI